MMVQTKCKLNNTELFLKLFHIQCKEIGNNKYYEETTELEKWQTEHSTTAANIDLTESLLDIWLKNNHNTVDKI